MSKLWYNISSTEYSEILFLKFLNLMHVLSCTNTYLKLENMQKMIYELEEQLHNEMQLKDEMEQKCRWDFEL